MPRRALRSLLATAGLLAAAVPSLAASSAAAQDAVAEGARQFRARCGTCHATEAGQNRVGPHLSGVVGRPAGAVDGARYSAALRESGIVWDRDTLDAFLADPRRTVPGTTMPTGLADGDRRAQVIEYLQTLSEGG